MSEYLVSLPYTLDDPVTKIDTADFRTFMAPGIMIVLIFFLSVTLTGDTFIEGKQDGTFLRSWVAGVHYIQVILAFLAANFVMVLIQSLITLVFMYVVYKVPLHGNLAWILIILILQGFCGMCFGFFLGICVLQSCILCACCHWLLFPNIYAKWFILAIRRSAGWFKNGCLVLTMHLFNSSCPRCNDQRNSDFGSIGFYYNFCLDFNFRFGCNNCNKNPLSKVISLSVIQLRILFTARLLF